jgi:protein TonB
MADQTMAGFDFPSLSPIRGLAQGRGGIRPPSNRLFSIAVVVGVHVALGSLLVMQNRQVVQLPEEPLHVSLVEDVADQPLPEPPPPPPTPQMTPPPAPQLSMPIIPIAAVVPPNARTVAANPQPPAPPAVEATPGPQTPAVPPVKATAGPPPDYAATLMMHLQRAKKYPMGAKNLRQQGVAYVRFSINRAGDVLSAKLERSSGFAMLDEEAVALFARATPLPALPDEMPAPMEMVIPIDFNLTHGGRFRH